VYVLYYSPANPNLAPHMVLEEVGVNYRLDGNLSSSRRQAPGGGPRPQDGHPVSTRISTAGSCFSLTPSRARIMTALYSERLADDDAGAEAVKRHAQEQVSATLDIIEGHLASAGPWMLGATYSAADPYLFMLCCWTVDMPSPARERPSLRRFCGAMIGRPAVRRAFERENLESPSRSPR
jgi:glutathione S-transferase